MMPIKRTTTFTNYSAGGGSLGKDGGFGRDHQHRQTFSSVHGSQAGAGSGFGGGCYGGGSSYSGGSSYGDFSSGARRSSLPVNEKVTMQDLNDRLASYLEKVKTLEETNHALEVKIQEFQRGPRTVLEQSWKTYEDTINPLKEKIKDMIISNGQKTLELDNIRLTADDFRTKYEMEVSLRRTVEDDINGLKELKQQAELGSSMLDQEMTSLQEEISDLKKNHEEELAEMRSQMEGTLNVEVDSAPSVDLNRIIANMREDYERVIKKHKQEAEAWYQSQVEAQHVEVVKTTQDVQTSKSETRELQQKCQSLHAELDALHSVKASLEMAVGATEARYQEKVHQIAMRAAQVEAQLAALRGDLVQQNQDYQNLFNIKVKLEAEIATYRQLLEGIDLGAKGDKAPPPAANPEEGITDQDLAS
ncbi:keratin, type I cytoskeletal 15-like [Ambystoma mexicanum]|uniref:keratin, type I cytoskeletal 15-like n=1 Tax=Ambystoma mexicanum TaxID=8296 RepID=UPI0037E72A83